MAMDAQQTTIFAARKIVTMNPARPEATHAAVRDGRILEVGSREECAAWGPYRLDDRFGDDVLIPGLIESHAHLMEGGLWALGVAVGAIDRCAPDGRRHKGLRSVAEVVSALRQIEPTLKDPDAPLLGWGVDPSFYATPEPITRRDLDQVSSTRPIFLLNASGHLAYVNSKILALANYADLHVEGVVRDAQGEPTGELQEIQAMLPALKIAAGAVLGGSISRDHFLNFARVAQLRGTTTVVDGGASTFFVPSFLATGLAATAEPDFPARIVSHYNGITVPTAKDMLEQVAALAGKGNDKLIFQGLKIVLDGSIQGFTGRLRFPRYYKTGANGIWNRPPEQVVEIVRTLHDAGLQVIAHCNGDEAAEVFVDAVAAAQAAKPRFDHRHFIVHGQLLDEALLRRMAALGMGATLFANHIYYWGDFHVRHTVGPARAQGMNPAASALRLGVTVAGHSDTPVSPIDPLFTLWCAVNRQTSSGQILGANERVSAYEALRMMTLDAAWLLHLDHDIGSIQVGKRADFTALEASPLDIAAESIKDIGVRGTIVGGTPFPIAAA
jgi:predicted amidohydrolase YtcJ